MSLISDWTTTKLIDIDRCVLYTFVHGSLIDRLRLQTHVSCGKNEGERGQDDTVNAADNGQRISPSNAAESHLEAIRFGAADLPEVIRVPAEWKGHATDHHADGYGWRGVWKRREID